jgi:Ca-activated chloride channel family protein
MCAVDIEPNRLSVAQDAALAFIEEQPRDTQIGIVAFAGLAEIIVPPTRDKNRLAEAIASLTTSMGTAMGSATLKSIDAIAELNPDVVHSGVNLGEGSGGPTGTGSPEAVYQPEIIVVLTDGANTRGPLPLDAAAQAADRNVRVYTIGFGTTELSEMVCSREQLGSDAFEGGFGGFSGFGGFGGNRRFGDADFRRFLLLDEPTLQAVADQTGGEYFRAENAEQLVQVFLDLPSQIVLQKETLEISVLFVGFGALLLLIAIFLSLRWNRNY